MRSIIFVLKNAPAAYALMGGIGLAFAALGEALTGGLRLHARAVEESMDPTNAASMVIWLFCVVYVAGQSIFRAMSDQ